MNGRIGWRQKKVGVEQTVPRLQIQMLLFKAILLADGVTNSNGKGSIL